jgi:hypothetical protein
MSFEPNHWLGIVWVWASAFCALSVLFCARVFIQVQLFISVCVQAVH